MTLNDSPFSILVLGVGDFFNKLYYHTSFTILLEGKPIQVDCPDPLPKMLHEAYLKSGIRFELKDIDHLILTHLHGDHSNGLEALGFHNHFIDGTETMIYTIPEVRDNIWDHKLKASMSAKTDACFNRIGEMKLEDFFNIHTMVPKEKYDVMGMELELRYTRHYVPCFGFRASYKGRSLGYSSDTCFDMGHIEFLQDCDLIIHETNRFGHTEYEKLLELPEWIKKKMLLIHIYDEFDVKNSAIRVAEEGMLYHV